MPSNNRSNHKLSSGVLASLVTLAILALVYTAIEAYSDRPPPPDVIRECEAIHPFLIEATGIEGYYCNRDTDSLVFTYVCKTFRGSDFYESVASSAQMAGWHLVQGPKMTKCFERVTERGGVGFWSVERVHVRIDSRNGRVAVGWVRVESDSRIDTFDDTREARWAEQTVWPLVSHLTDSEASGTVTAP